VVVDEVAQDVDLVVALARAHLDSRHQLQRVRRGGGEGLVHAGHGVVVGDGDHVEPRAGGHLHDLCG
jgi:hypothetical protein